MFSHFWNVNIVSFFFSLAGWWNHLLVCWLSSFFLSVSLAEVLYIRREIGFVFLAFSLLLQLSRFFFSLYLLARVKNWSSPSSIFFLFYFFSRAMRFSSWQFFFLLLIFVLQHSFFDLWILTSNFTLVFMTHWCYPWHLSLKLFWLLSWQLSCINFCLCNIVTSTVFTMKSC